MHLIYVLQVIMDQNFYISLCIFCVSQSVMAFNIDPVSWKTVKIPAKEQSAFGYKIIQNPSSLIVSDPLIQINTAQRGQIYTCSVTQQSNPCSPLYVNVPPEAVNMSLGLSMIQDPYSSKLMVCGPTIPKPCGSLTTYNGMCFISENNMATPSFQQRPIPNSLRECPGQIDIAFLLDGSASVVSSNFVTMKTFVENMIGRFSGRDAKFAIAQYSFNCVIHYNFNGLNTRDSTTWRHQVSSIIYQNGGYTNTAAAITKLVKNLFEPAEGARPLATRVLLVITDGVSHDRHYLTTAALKAKSKNIISIAIGVGNAFNNDRAKEELNTIASDPDANHVFRVTDFNALNSILENLEKNIIAIEGTQTSGDSSRMEFAQDGFSTAFVSQKSVLLSAVGAFQWKGGYEEYSSANNYFQAGTIVEHDEHDSYLGYSMAVATLSGINYAVLGAPRYHHKGQVVVVDIAWNWQKQALNSPEPQTGAYFGAEVCVVNVSADRNKSLVLISAPTYTDKDREGKVFVFSFSRREYLTFLDVVLVGVAGQWGRFGSSLASPADLNMDGFRDVVIGAPLENDGKGSIYIFNGKDGGIISTYSQRIDGASGLRLFGISLSQSSVDHSQDKLPDIAVGSMGEVLLLRSRPIMLLETKVTYNPTKIPTSHAECRGLLTNTMTVCFTMREYNHNIQDLNANIKYTIRLDAKRQRYRAFFSEKNTTISNEMQIGLRQKCHQHSFKIEDCSEDALNPLVNQLNFTFEGISSKAHNLKPVLKPGTQNSTDYNLDFEINCGSDNICIDDLRMDFNFSGATGIEVGVMQEINVTVFVENKGENSYNTLFKLQYPYGLSYRRISTKQGRAECVSQDGEQGVSLGNTVCYISKPIFKGNAQAVFEITYSINKESTFGQNVMFSAEVTSGNDKHSPDSKLFAKKSISVKYAINIALIRHESTTIHINFTAGKNDLKKPVTQILTVENDMQEIHFTVFIRVPMKLGDKNIWTDSDQFQIPGCKRKGTEPASTNFKEIIKKRHVVNCSVAVCAVFTCDINLITNERTFYYISGNVSSGWIEQFGLRAAVFQLVSTAYLEYDKSKYVLFSTDSRDNAPTQIDTQVEVYEEANLTKEIVGGVIGGLLLLALITLALYKAGFFKSQYKQMLEEAQEDAGGQAAQ